MAYRNNSSGLHIVEIELTNRCNLRCKHCYVNKDQDKSLTYEQVKYIIDQANSMGVNRIVFAGGEPLLYRDLFKCAKYAKELEIPEVILLTNGIFINDECAQKLNIFDSVQLSIDSVIPNNNNLRQNYINKLENAVRLLQKNKINVYLFATLYKSLLSSIDELVLFANEHNVKLGFNTLMKTNYMIENECLSPNELRQAFKRIAKLQYKFNINCNNHLFFLIDRRMRDEIRLMPRNKILGGCMAGIAAIYISSNGDIFPCPFVPVVVGNIFKHKLEYIWNRSEDLIKLRNRSAFDVCGSCEYVHYCGGCRASSYIETGNLYGRDPMCIK